MKRTLLTIILLFLIMIPLNTEEINLKELRLSLEDCLKKASTKSYQALHNRLDDDELTLDLVRDWFVFLPEFEYEVDYGILNYETGKKAADKSFPGSAYIEGYPLESFQVEDESTFDMQNIQHKIRFSQRLFDSRLVQYIIDSKEQALDHQILKTTFTTSINDLVRKLYYETLILQEKAAYLNDFLTNYKKIESVKIYSLLEERTLIAMQKDLLTTNEEIVKNKYRLLNLIMEPLSKELILTSSLPKLTISKTQDEKYALMNNIILKHRQKMFTKEKQQYALSILDFIPELNLRVKHEISDNFDVGVDMRLRGKNFQADVFGEYLIYENTDELLVSKLDDGFKSSSTNNDLTYYDMRDTTFSLIGKISLDKLARNGVTVKEYRNNIHRVNLLIKEYEAEIKYSLAKKYDELIKLDTLLSLDEKSMTINRDIYTELLANVKTFDIDALYSVSSYLNNYKNAVNTYYNKKYDYYESISEYYRILEGKL